MSGTYVTDITHYLDDTGELAAMPGPARKLASFLVLLIDETTQAVPAKDYDTRIRCRTNACKGSIRASLPSMTDEISWYCPECGHNGGIRNWKGTKWDQAKRNAELRPPPEWAGLSRPAHFEAS
jgi:hypothetical protein